MEEYSSLSMIVVKYTLVIASQKYALTSMSRPWVGVTKDRTDTTSWSRWHKLPSSTSPKRPISSPYGCPPTVFINFALPDTVLGRRDVTVSCR